MTDIAERPDGHQNSYNGEVHENRTPMVSVCCLAYNHAKYIRQALDSFLNQETDFPIEIVIHDDASTDGTDGIIREYEKKYPGIIKPLYESENQYSKGISNISGVFNFPRAGGKYIAMCEGDDYWSDMQKLRKQVDYMESHPEVSLCCHAADIVSEDGAFRTQNAIEPFPESRKLRPEELISKKTNIPTASMLFRTKDVGRLPEWYFDCPVGDIPLQLYLLLKGDAYYSTVHMSVYRMGREGSWGDMMDSEAMERQKFKWESHYDAMKRLYDAFDADSGGRWHGAACEALKRQRFHIDLKEGKTSVVLDKANESFVAELPAAEARLLKLKARHPAVYAAMQKAYRMLK